MNRMIIKINNKNEYTIINKSDYICLKHYYEEIMRIKFNKKLNSTNIVDHLKDKIKEFKK